MCLGVLLIVSGLLAIRFTEDEFHISTPPYFIGAFLVGGLVVCAGGCSLYVYISKAPLRDYYFLELSAARRIQRAVTGNTVSSILSLIGCVLGLFVCVVFAIGPCDTDMWFSKCSFKTNRTEHRALAVFITIFLCSCTILSTYASLMSCIHGWVFDFEACAVQTRSRKQNGEDRSGSRPNSTFQPLPMFDIEENVQTPDDGHISNNYNKTSSFKQTNDGRHLSDSSNEDQHHGYARKHVTGQQPPSYVAVLNDPAMKKKLKERNSRLQDQ
ncbi:uncharacterized protein LOC123548999 isoform X2 [Mercenaria mercenaria]|nr:uncharacterized protein LOC123548999 isoform X2 [Mercenaria mercenaria]